MKTRLHESFFFILILISTSYASNELSVKDPSLYGAKLGYIEKATLVIEPFGSYVEQSLYLEYSDRHQFTSDFLEIVHRFELPKDAVVNDMWLWMGDSVMQARMFDTWTARGIYDSIVGTKYDPAFLAKTGSQFELRIYPLKSGSYRKVKITFIVPTKWYGNKAVTELPLEMLLANNASQKPLEILFRVQRDIWGSPSIVESPQNKFIEFVDTLGYKYQRLMLEDISGFSSLNMEFNTNFTNGYYISGYRDKSDNTFFQFGISPKDFFNIKPDSSSQDVLVALDFSGSYRKNLSANLPYYRSLINSSLKSNDNFKLLVSGNEQIVDYTNSFIMATSDNINNAFIGFENSDHAKSIDQTYMPNILFCDRDASTNWNFSGLTSITHVSEFDAVNLAMNYITQSDIVAAYTHGFDNPIDQTTADQIIMRLDSLFAYGGRFLTYYDYNREAQEKLARHYIQGLKVKAVEHGAVTLYRNSSGNIGANFPESFTRNASYFLEFTDPDAKIELMDKNGRASVISKKIKNGLIVVTGIWSLRDDDAMKILLGAPLLGVNSNNKPYTLDHLLARIKEEYNAHNFAKAIILSDSDSLLTKSDASLSATNYINNFPTTPPTFFTVNLLDNDLFTPAYVVEGQTEYYGSGYLLNEVANKSNGIHMEKHLYDWSYISTLLAPYKIPMLNNVNVNTHIDNGNGEIFELREVNRLADPNKPRFFLGISNAQNSITFDISGRFEGTQSDSSKQFTFLVPHDTTTYNKIVSSMLGNEKINDRFNETPIDTAEVVRLSLRFNLLTDYTALLALEPNDEFHFIRDPLDESGFSTGIDENNDGDDSTVVSIYPNPFNSLATIYINLKSPSHISATIYNILGQRVVDIANDEFLSGEKKYTWNGRDIFGVTVASGFYIFRLIVTDAKTLKEHVYTHKLVYLK